jgi:hypothetical protein
MKINVMMNPVSCGALLTLCCVGSSSAFVTSSSSSQAVHTTTELHSSFRNRFVEGSTNYANDHQQGNPDVSIPSSISAPMEMYNREGPGQMEMNDQQRGHNMDMRNGGGQQYNNGFGHPNYRQPDSFFQGSGSSTVQGGNRQTWSQNGNYNEPGQKQVFLHTHGRPLEANLQVWEGPNNVPESVRVWSENGARHPFTSMVSNRFGSTMNVQNVGPQEFPLEAGVQAGAPPLAHGVGQNNLYENKQVLGGGVTSDQAKLGFVSSSYRNFGRAAASDMPAGQTVQGDGALKTFTIEPNVRNVIVTAHSEGTPINAIVEIWQGPGNARQIAEIYTQDGLNRPFSAVLETPGYGCTIAVRNVGSMTFPMRASVEPYSGY